MLSRSLLIACAAVFCFLASPALAQGEVSGEEVITLDTRPRVKQSFLLLKPYGEVRGIVVMFPGHEGNVHFVQGKEGYEVTHEGGGFTVKKEVRETYRKNGLLVALLAPPSAKPRGMDTAFRSSAEHAEDVRVVLGYLKDKYGQTSYLHGHCRGTFSPASITTTLKNAGIAGMILTSPRSIGKHGAVTDYAPGVVTVPVLLVQHKEDPCNGTPYAKFGEVKAFYEQSAKKVDAILVSGGSMQVTGPNSCNAGPHAFGDLEQETATAISNWILGKDYAQSIDGPIRR